jgi:hypothetical protein
MELWVEGAASVADLQYQMRQRGYKNLPMISDPVLWCSSIPTGEPSTYHGTITKGNYPTDLSPGVIRKIIKNTIS